MVTLRLIPSHTHGLLKKPRWGWLKDLGKGVEMYEYKVRAFSTQFNSSFAINHKGAEVKATAKQSQFVNATFRNVGGNMLREVGHRVAMCWVLLAQI